jgi:hypothetical protein
LSNRRIIAHGRLPVQLTDDHQLIGRRPSGADVRVPDHWGSSFIPRSNTGPQWLELAALERGGANGSLPAHPKRLERIVRRFVNGRRQIRRDVVRQGWRGWPDESCGQCGSDWAGARGAFGKTCDGAAHVAHVEGPMRGNSRWSAADAVQRGQLGVRRITRWQRREGVRRRLGAHAYTPRRTARDDQVPPASPEATYGT